MLPCWPTRCFCYSLGNLAPAQDAGPRLLDRDAGRDLVINQWKTRRCPNLCSVLNLLRWLGRKVGGLVVFVPRELGWLCLRQKYLFCWLGVMALRGCYVAWGSSCNRFVGLDPLAFLLNSGVSAPSLPDSAKTGRKLDDRDLKENILTPHCTVQLLFLLR